MATTSTSMSFTRSHAKKTLGAVDYLQKPEFPHGMLPTGKDIIQNMLYLLRPKQAGQAQRSRVDAAQLVAELLQEHWLFCNLYTIHTRHIKNHILKLYGDTCLIQTRKSRQNDNFIKRVAAFSEKSERTGTYFEVGN
uniref:Uncharacterized protein n=1 Tax=Sphaeramia orbicularis TaxID=375764 RepID=A0A673BW14_9TELE